MIENEMTAAAVRQLALDYACRTEDFTAKKNTVSVSKRLPGRRAFNDGDKADFFKMATFGGGAVASVSAEILAFTKDLFEKFDGKESAELFGGASVYLLNKKLADYGKTLGACKIYFLPKTPYKHTPRNGYIVKVCGEPEIRSELYKHKGFENALTYRSDGERRDKIAVCVFNGGTVAGMAGASNDSERFWQIGIDVKAEYRRKGLAADLVAALTREVFSRGAVPYYGTWAGNIASQRLALKCGYEPAWTEVEAVDADTVLP
jgi:GNAT superfamily N-acetyltransferase